MTEQAGAVAMVIPVKPLAKAKSRLREVLDPLSLAGLQLVLLEHVLAASKASAPVTTRYIVGGDEWIHRVALAVSATILRDPGRGLNQAVILGSRTALEAGANATLVLPADLGLLTTENITAVVEASRGLTRVVICRATRDGGTNALLVPRGMRVCPDFGPNSFSRHMESMERAEIPVRSLDQPGIAFDLDTPKDLDMYCGLRPDLDEAIEGWKRKLTGDILSHTSEPDEHTR